MIAIPGKSGEEAAIAAFIREQLLNAGASDKHISFDQANRKSSIGGQCGNLIVKLPGNVRGPRRLLMGHIDTVPLCVGCKPVRDGDYIKSADPTTALGGDDRAGAAVVLNSILMILKHDLPHPPLTLVWPVQEEVGLKGAANITVSKLGNPKLCFNWDGGPPDHAVVGATGDYNIDIKINGIASHAGGLPEHGVNAAAIASVAISDLVENGWHGLIVKGKNTGTSNIGVVQGGDATNVVMPELTIQAEARSHDPKFRQRIINEFRKAFERAAKKISAVDGRKGSIEFGAQLKYESFRMKKSEPCLKVALDAVAAVGLEPATRISNGGLDANWLTAHGFPTVTLGCGQDAVHTVNEVLHVPNFLNACRIGLVLATGAV
ncbi:MAG: peptidase M20 [Planctomycetaceae bacterium]|nr:peptidase M20 [Planctomycetaceae bacterium]